MRMECVKRDVPCADDGAYTEQTQQGVSYEDFVDLMIEGYSHKLGRMTQCPYRPLLIANCLFNAWILKDGDGAVDDHQDLKITTSNYNSSNKLNPEINDHYNILTRKVKSMKLKAKDKAKKENCMRSSSKYEYWLQEKELNIRQRRWIELLLSDYNVEIKYHPGKAKVVLNALSRKEE
ncbi:hypothetical protein Tco_0205484 [Tanacetum coccineum]